MTKGKINSEKAAAPYQFEGKELILQYMSIIVAVFSVIGDIASVICAVVAIVESVRENHHDKT